MDGEDIPELIRERSNAFAMSMQNLVTQKHFVVMSQPSSVFPALNNPYGTPPYPQPQPKKHPEPKK